MFSHSRSWCQRLAAAMITAVAALRMPKAVV